MHTSSEEASSKEIDVKQSIDKPPRDTVYNMENVQENMNKEINQIDRQTAEEEIQPYVPSSIPTSFSTSNNTPINQSSNTINTQEIVSEIDILNDEITTITSTQLSPLSQSQTKTDIQREPRKMYRRPSAEREFPGDRMLKKCKLSSNISSYGILLLQKQYKQLSKNPPDGMSFGLRDNDITRWRIIIEGPHDTIFEGGVFPASLEFPDEYVYI